MIFFEWFDVEPRLDLDEGALRKTFIRKSREVHPDMVGDDATEESAALNDAYQVLRDPIKRCQYVLRESNFDLEKAELPPMFLMEMMEVNEAVEELDRNDRMAMEENMSAVQKRIEEMLDSIKNCGWNGDVHDPVLEGVRQDYFKLKYLLRLKETIGSFADSF